MAPSVALKPSFAVVAGETPGFQPVTVPERLAKMNSDLRVVVPLLIKKSGVGLNTCPVGCPPGIVTSSATLFKLLPFTSPRYSALRSAPSDDTQKAPPAGFREMPQALIRRGSCKRATPGWSDTRSVAR